MNIPRVTRICFGKLSDTFRLNYRTEFSKNSELDGEWPRWDARNDDKVRWIEWRSWERYWIASSGHGPWPGRRDSREVSMRMFCSLGMRTEGGLGWEVAGWLASWWWSLAVIDSNHLELMVCTN